ncbi:putative toxin-antitoxin system toxin component, PIN family [Persicitalea sp.]|uniref:PIN domain-containing protein n=1 Tax=Persicitalea sp. TaxID=3100273 RepID=UPI0035930ADE
MIVIIDINILLISLPKKSPYRPIFDALKDGKFELVISNDILFEYHEKLAEKTSTSVADNVVKLLLSLDNVSLQYISFKWGIMQNDPDDNKYADCALIANAEFLVSEVRHFNIFQGIKLPALKVIGIDAFLTYVISLP